MAHPLLKISLFIYIKTISYLLKQKRWLILVTSGMELTTCFKNIPMQNTIPENITAAKAKVKIVVIIFILFNINTVISIFLSRSAGLPPLSPSRTVHATFTAHGSCNSVNYFSF